jgi:NAD(P)-dependent dehydrogenase (short-subunit alcohol dehydrogenase family)
MSRILITGCSKGLGRATAIELADRGHEVVASARNPQTLADLPAGGATAA